MEEISKNLKKIFKVVFKLRENNIESATFNNVKRWDSMNHLNLILSIESSFKIKIDAEESVKFLSYKYIYKYLKNIKAK